jgi:HEAT repeat protein
VLRAKTLFRALQRRARHERAAPPPAREPEPPLERREEVGAALRHLDEDDRRIVVLRYLHDLEYGEVARILGLTPQACRLRVHRAMEKLRESLGPAAPALVGAMALLEGARPAHALAEGALHAKATVPLGGLLLMGTTLKVTLVAGAAVVALSAALLVREGRRSPGRAAEGRAQRPVAALEDRDAPGAAPPGHPHASTAGTAAPLAETVPAAEREEYAQMREALSVFREGRRVTAEAQRLVREITGSEPDEGDALRPDPTTRLHVMELVARYRSLPPGPERLATLRAIVEAHGGYLEATGDAGLLPFLEDVIANSPVPEEREAAVPVSPAALDLLLRQRHHADARVRAAAVYALAAIDDPGARGAVLDALRDAEGRVRWVAALQVEFAEGGGGAEALLDGLAQETHPLALDARVRALRALDPDDGERRIEAALAGAPPPALLPEAPAADAPRPAQEPRPDPLTREHLDRVRLEYMALPPGRERLQILERFCHAHRSYLDRTRDEAFLGFLDEVVAGSPSEEERRAVVLSFPGTSAALARLVAWAESPHADVRAAAGRALAAVPDADGRAAAALWRLVEDPVPSVRRQAALAYGAGARVDVERLLKRLAAETDESAAYALVHGIVKHGGRARVEEVAAASPLREWIAYVLARMDGDPSK